uniref:Uncharacterized protein n=1 Tax=Klebsiella pneumoniae TaxID=573 RepID=A0A8B0SUW0_KLEPN|nr:hypothetical protein [Klebsiella pneumoniae]
MNKPVVFSDLDDTPVPDPPKKMVDELALEPFRTGALDRSLTPRSFMTEEQAMLVDWLLEHADLIPVTARGTEEISRVQIPFRSSGSDHSWRGDPSSRWYARQRLESPYAGVPVLLRRPLNINATYHHRAHGCARH